MLETERLIFRKFTLADLDALIEMRSDPEVNKYLGGTRLQNPEAITKRMRVYMDSYDKYGFGACAMIWKETGEMIGWSGLQPLEDTGETEVGYGMKKEFWGKGIGYECALAWLRYGFEKIGLERIVAVAIPGNTGSQRIMEKCGMKYEKTEPHYGEECVFYAVTKDEFLRRFEEEKK
jgi:[ribosomal protein S5]-alanine N-acetyltransferase